MVILKRMLNVGPDFKDQFVVNIINAINSGLKVHVVYPLCPNKPLAELGEQFTKLFPPFTIQNVWLSALNDIADPQCSWAKHSGQQNCQYLKQILQGLKKYNINAGPFINKNEWALNFGSVSACPQISNFLMWWIPGEGEQDSQPNFNSYRQIGGWTKPFMNLYSYKSVCGSKEFLMNYRE